MTKSEQHILTTVFGHESRCMTVPPLALTLHKTSKRDIAAAHSLARIGLVRIAKHPELDGCIVVRGANH